jgi:hypothetical protein
MRLCWTRDHPMVERDAPTTVIASLKYYLKNRLVHRSGSHMKYAWYAYTRSIITLALEGKIWSMTIAEQGSDDQPIRFDICIAGANANIYERRDETEGRCRCCNYELYWSSYDKAKLLRLQPTLTNNMVQSYVCDEAFKRMKLSLERVT